MKPNGSGRTFPNDDLPYATVNGFYLGDEVGLPDGRRGCIDEIVHKHVFGKDDDVQSVVRLDDELWLDSWLVRVG